MRLWIPGSVGKARVSNACVGVVCVRVGGWETNLHSENITESAEPPVWL